MSVPNGAALTVNPFAHRRRPAHYHVAAMKLSAARGGTRPAIELGSDPAEVWLVERVIAVARVLVAAAALFVVRLDPERYGPFADTLLIAYVAFALALMAVLLPVGATPRRVPFIVQTIDLVFAAALTLFSGPNSPLFAIFLYPLVAAAYRWGFGQVMVTAAVIDGLLVAEAILVRATWLSEVNGIADPPEFDPHSVLRRAITVAVAAAVVGYLAENEKRRRFEARAISQVLSRIRLDGTLVETVNLILTSVGRLFRANGVVMIVEEQASGRILRWATDSMDDDRGMVRPEPVSEAQRGDYLFEAPGAAWYASGRWRLQRRRRFGVALDVDGRRLKTTTLRVPEGFLTANPCRRLVGATLPLGDEWTGRLFVLDPGVGVHREQNARFALRLAGAVGPALYGHYLLRRLRTDSQALERRRIARELHDGVTQSLLGLEMEVVVLRRRAMAEAPQFTADLSRVHAIVRDEVIAVRELMEGIRVGDVEASDLPHHLSEVVDRFSRHTGIVARFISDGRAVALTPHVCRQVTRIVHEALVNVRKHSAASHVVVRADAEGNRWKLSITDDGHGFQFAGRLSQDELEKTRQWPRAIAERVQLIGGVMTVESKPGLGASIEVAVPLEEVS